MRTLLKPLYAMQVQFPTSKILHSQTLSQRVQGRLRQKLAAKEPRLS